LVRAKVNQEQWVTAGLPDTVNVLASGRAIFTPVKIDKGVNAAYFAGPDQLVASGYMWEENRKQMAFMVTTADKNNFIQTKPWYVYEVVVRNSVPGAVDFVPQGRCDPSWQQRGTPWVRR